MASVLHNHNSQGWTCKTSSLNPYFGKEHIVRYTESKGARKHRDAGLRLFTSGHLQKLVFSTEDTAETVVKAQVLASMATRTVYSVGVKLLKCDGELLSNFNRLYSPRTPLKKISDAPRLHKKRAAYSCLRTQDSNLSTLSLINLHGNFKECGLDCFADVLEANDFLPEKQRKVESPATEDVAGLPLRWLERAKQGNALLSYTDEEVTAVEAATRLQSACLLWHMYREGLITASVAHRVYTWVRTCQTKMGPHDPRRLIAAVVGKKKGRATFAMKRGLLCEPEARKAFQDKNDSHVELEVTETGLFLSRHHAFLGASPDGLVKCKCCAPRLLEIKVPLKIQDFAKRQLRAGELKKSSGYYTQVQVQMGVTGLNTCVLFVYSNEECRQISVPFDQSFFTEFVERCKFFTSSYLLPYISSNW
nr:uncharacterized protein LOC119171446 [Rhipicephalus microplus]